MDVNEELNRLCNTNTFFEKLVEESIGELELKELKASSLVEIQKFYSMLNRVTYKQEFTKEVSEVIGYNIRELESLDSDRLDILIDFEKILKNGVLKEFYSKKNVDLTHKEQMLLISYMQDLGILSKVAGDGLESNWAFFTIVASLLNRNTKNSEAYLYTIKSVKSNVKSLEKILDVFKKAKSKKGQELVNNDLKKLK